MNDRTVRTWDNATWQKKKKEGGKKEERKEETIQ